MLTPLPGSGSPDDTFRHVVLLLREQHEQTVKHFDEAVGDLKSDLAALDTKLDQAYVRKDVLLLELGAIREQLAERTKDLDALNASLARQRADLEALRTSTSDRISKAEQTALRQNDDTRLHFTDRMLGWAVALLMLAATILSNVLLKPPK